ncbi:hypothetical protein GCM10010495_31840 [Kitasatospora herbaricolor]|uniref:hypothetical protein n=1 Tax=Kitasatospora herbaricolor TaxID=68217 RepID=UPI001749BD87|nr:hypothetical protein [Kitasatospora herbaricolor]MDQ0312367.1 hypothetical protein [Kitasatospora herbaricolor]GGV15310.1 hypothetical protein GCM10010495_31840 [Kitasatospora herbaricolor]
MTGTKEFLLLSAELTGFGAGQLSATGLADTYRSLVLERAGPNRLDRLRAAVTAGADRPPAFPDEPVRELARAVVHLWYLGIWPGLPPAGVPGTPDAAAGGSADAPTDGQVEERVDERVVRPADGPFVVSSRAYAEGLVWRTFGTRAPGTVPQEHGSWSLPPTVEEPVAGPPGPRSGAATAPAGQR